MKSLILMMQFLTKLPLPFEINSKKEDFSRGIIWFPFVGLIIGLMLYGINIVMVPLTNRLLTAIILVTFEVFITGGLHLDGLADSFDGLYSYRDKKRMLEIMKDSRIGANGVLALIIVLILKIGLIYSLTGNYEYLLILMPVTSRYLVVFLSWTSKYARENGMGGFFIGETSFIQFLFASIVVVLSFYLQLKAFIVLGLLIGITLIYRWHVYHKIDGLTGDILGAWVEMSEVIFLFLALILI